MGKEIQIKKCERCGEDFLYETHGKGSKPKYCEKCRPLQVSEAKQRYIEKHKKKHDMEDSFVSENVDTIKSTIKSTTDYIINRRNERTETGDTACEKYSYFVAEISRLLLQLDTTRVELCNISKQLYEYQSNYDKSDQAFMHKLEDFDTNDLKGSAKFLNDWKFSRNNRRNVKDLIEVVSTAIDAIPYKNYQNAVSVLKPYKK